MTSETSRASMEAFVSYDFNTESGERLGILKVGHGPDQVRTLVKFNRDEKNHKISDSLTSIVKLIETHQTEWHKITETQNQIEFQCSRLMKIVRDHNEREDKNHISYDNPFKWRITISLSFDIYNKTKKPIRILEKPRKSFSIHRSTTKETVYKRVTDFIREAKVKYKDLSTLTISDAKVVDLFKKFKTRIPSSDRASKDFFFSKDKPARNQEIKISVTVVDEDFIKTMAKAQKATPKPAVKPYPKKKKNQSKSESGEFISPSLPIIVPPPVIVHHKHHHHQPSIPTPSHGTHHDTSSFPSNHHSDSTTTYNHSSGPDTSSYTPSLTVESHHH